MGTQLDGRSHKKGGETTLFQARTHATSAAGVSRTPSECKHPNKSECADASPGRGGERGLNEKRRQAATTKQQRTKIDTVKSSRYLGANLVVFRVAQRRGWDLAGDTLNSRTKPQFGSEQCAVPRERPRSRLQSCNGSGKAMREGGQSAAPVLDEHGLSAPFDCQHLALGEKVRTLREKKVCC
jgi:hypothetical protein